MNEIVRIGILISIIAVTTSALLSGLFRAQWFYFSLLIWFAILCILLVALWYLERKEADRIILSKALVTNRESNLTNVALHYATENSELNALRNQHLGLIRYLSECRDIPTNTTPAKP
jgi:hypothetical protein